MMMEIYLSIEKAKHYNIDIDKCYDKIDKYFIENGVKKISTGIYLMELLSIKGRHK